ncbi:MAG: SDR family NAD(P)-dependent oxidoreductase [Gammaproteobacteria bacterium PRO9]|nr:SDR family NAD(P)-dependent oxidoreductase [Gammaproteobacteria bacterium PRO9]
MEPLFMGSGTPFVRSARRSGIRYFPCLLGAVLCSLLPARSPAQATAAMPDTRPYVVLVTNADQGIGYEFVRQYSERGWAVIATARDPRSAAELNALAGRWDSDVKVEKLDATSGQSVRALAARYKGQPIDLLINNMDLTGDIHAQDYRSFDFGVYDQIFDANAAAPLRVIGAFMDNVAASRQKRIMTLSSATGSIQLAHGGLLFYRSSKAALNMAIRTLSREVRQDPDPQRQALVFGLIDPGSMAGATAGDATSQTAIARLTPRESAEYCIAVIEGYTPVTSGSFLDRKGTALPW